jgi:hypothetical protein
MGAMSGYVEGATKIATWKAYLAEVGSLARRDQEQETEFHVQFPRNKKDAYEGMEPIAGGGWRLYYRFRT